MSQNSADQALSFGQAASHYDRVRPSYPAEAIQWVLGDVTTVPGARHQVVDLGAGTGLLTRVIVGITDATVIPVEPDPLMRERLAATTPSVTPIAGSAESIGLSDASVDAVLAGQAYHWFDHEKAHPEIARVVRPGGIFAPVWNIRDEDVAWVAEYGRLIHDGPSDGHSGRLVDPDFGPGFGSVTEAAFRHSVPMNAEGLVALLASRSHYLIATDERRAEVVASIRGFAETLPETFEMPYVTYCYRAVRL